ncbi:hypothetical protein E3E26_02290 [Thermococcus sp. LS1]|uniref:hypothetical protein n=1 Tax=Thermococcus sp. LS1 TaxID=1638259 RepID=UPI00143A36F0|nr:hypothetical protein [Thermococcus sp. LS1]NJD98627.1 hypothetical protein [Thermococcus sp. LS1]
MDPGVFFFFLIIFIILAIILWGHRQRETAKQKAERFREGLRIEGNELVLPRRMRLVKGRLTLKGYWSSSGRSRHYHIDRKFTQSEELETDRIELKPERFSLIMNKSEETLIDVPAYLLMEPELENILLIPIIPSYRFEIDKQSLEASKEMEFAHARIDLTEWGFSGRLYATVQKCRGARVELKRKGPKVTEKLAETRESAEFSREFMREKLMIISNKNVVDPREFKKVLGKSIFLEGHGEYIIELTLDVPLGSDIHDRATLMAEPGEEIPEGETRVEIVI